ncbi:MAG: peptidylprolyl isomerase [Gammaproteobacteria bacterium]|nr:peptidylprolyl isomerase [Gammaproteobacteria bacterium]
MKIEKGKVVTMHYCLSEPGQQVIEDSRQQQPVVYLHGYHGMLEGLEQALEGKQAGDTLSVTLSPEQAYGQRSDQALLRVSKSHIMGGRGSKQVFKPGMVVQINTSDGPRTVMVLKVGLKSLDVDANHPLAGRTVQFDIEVVALRDASAEELEHQHVHGDGGHHH